LADPGKVSILQRKTRAAQGRRARGGVGDIWRRLLPRVAADRLGLELTVSEIEEREVDLAAALADVPGEALLLSLVDDWTPTGVAILDAGLLAGLIEIQTTGSVTTMRRDPRRPTVVDVALVGHVIDDWTGAVAAAQPDVAPFPRAGDAFAEVRAAILALPEGSCRETRLVLDLGGGKRVGKLTLLTVAGAAPARAGADPDALRDIILPIEAPLEAVLCRVKLPLARAMSLSPGDLVPLPNVSVRRISLEAPLGTAIAPAHLGQSRGFRAVRILDPAIEATANPAPPPPSPLPMPPAPPLGGTSGLPDLPDLPPIADGFPAGLPPLSFDPLPGG
jgi:flagellar motor switch protein FliM